MQKQSQSIGWRPWAGLLLVVIALVSFYLQAAKSWVQLQGEAQGTTYTIKALASGSTESLRASVGRILEEVDASMSLWRKDSEINRFNAWPSQKPFDATTHFLRVLKTAAKVYEASEGLYDPTVSPLVDLWGFGPSGQPTQSPDEKTLNEARAKVGFGHLKFLNSHQIMKEIDGLEVDLNSIAPGYTVDLLADFLEGEGIEDYMIELGGEVLTHGKSPRGGPWVIGIHKPLEGASPDEFFRLVWPENGSLATSGNYRAVWKDGVKKIVHSIDPKSGLPVEREVLSASILHSSCMVADAWATAAMLMPWKKSIEIMESQKIDFYLILNEEGVGELREKISSGFQKHSSKAEEEK